GIEWLQVFYGATRIGVAVVGLSVRYRDTEIAYMLADSDARGVVCAARADGFDLLAMLDRLAPGLPALRDVIPLEATPERSLDLPRLLDARPEPSGLAAARAAVSPDDLAMVIYTSGTTGRPKGAGLTHRSMLASAKAQADHTRVDAADVIQLALPLNHVGGITCGVLTHLLGGGVCDLVPVFKAETMLERIEAHPPSMLAGVPTMLTLLLAHPRIDTVGLGSVRLITTGGSNVDSTLLAQLQARMPGAAIMNLYGLSESSGALVMTPWDCTREQLMTSIGRPLADAELRVIDKDGAALPAGVVGELCFRGVGVVPGYIGAAAGNDAFQSDGWLRTGDLGEVDDAGFIRLRGRAKDMYIQGGYNVYPAEIEDLIARHPKVLMVAGIGVPDPVLGEIGRYYVVPKPGSGLTEREIVEHCAGRLADYKQPRQVVLRDELPLTPAGKIRKAALREEVVPQDAHGA
ncbi:MAG: hypothetical protein RIS35_2116, partial [Pseudomonadota bacterium]